MYDIVNTKLVIGDKVQIEYTSVDERNTIKAVVCCCTINNGKGIAIFEDEYGKVYTWRPSSPHGEVTRIDSLPEDKLINPYVRVFSTETLKYRPVDSRTAEYICSKIKR